MKTAKSMLRCLAGCAVLALVLAAVGPVAGSHGITLKLAYFSSDRSTIYLSTTKPFVDAINSHAGGHLKIDANTSGVLGKDPAKQLQLVLDGKADLAYILPGYTPERFPDTEIIELPGLFRDVREATLVFTRLVAQSAMSGFEELFVVGAFANEPETLHLRTPVKSLDDLRGMRIRVNNPIQAGVLEKLGAIPEWLPLTKVASALSRGDIDGATVPPSPAIEFGIARIAAHHYLLAIGSVPQALVMKRETFDKLPPEVQSLIRSYSGEWTAERYITMNETEEEKALKLLKANPSRTVIVPSQRDRDLAAAAFAQFRKDWAARSPRHGELLAKAEAILAKIRSSQ